MPIRTCIDMVQAAALTAGISGVGQTMLAEDANTGFELLLEIVGLWGRERFMSWRNIEEVFPATGAKAYTLSDRPARLESAFARLIVGQPIGGINNAGPMDFPLWILENQDEYNDISLKNLSTFPAAVWYNPGFPVGTVYPWPIPPAGQFELHIFYQAGLPDYTALTDPLNLPIEYIRALRYELALLMQLNYGKPPDPAIAAALAGTKAAIKATNARVRALEIPGTLVEQMPGQGGISGSVGPHQSVIVLNSGNAVLG